MSLIIRINERNSTALFMKLSSLFYSSTSQSTTIHDDKKSGEFRVLHLSPKPIDVSRRKIVRAPVPPPRTNEMPTDQDWVSVWPGPRSFHPAVVPLPIRQGYPKKNSAPPSKYGNAELMKIPNFLHLTPPAIKRHCEALKEFCTEWPTGLETDEKCDEHFPLEYISSDYCYSSPTIRDPLSRIVTIKVKLSQLQLDTHARDKILRLLGNRYDSNTGIITIVADRCPTRKQNREYAEYLLTAVYNEAWRMELWETEKALVDMEYYDWDKHKSRETLMAIHTWPASPSENLDYESIPSAVEYKVAVSDLINNGEDQFTVNKYREAVKNLLNLKQNINSE
ncbi:hypothetical protein PV327_002958 [Microctonus hyperodae]|uniref:Small ribosomal subunit protein mS35 mitochondrial conserved domain-containing protein n=1 Tax=Microctonus hyperodae TaxID=165561 RepID=A0AA39G3G0_MICHY|nr:hypothetical protein PV327_002958 [Microctonus hyperodae]